MFNSLPDLIKIPCNPIPSALSFSHSKEKGKITMGNIFPTKEITVESSQVLKASIHK